MKDPVSYCVAEFKNDTFPVGDSSLKTVAVQVLFVPTSKGAGLQETIVFVADFVELAMSTDAWCMAKMMARTRRPDSRPRFILQSDG